MDAWRAQIPADLFERYDFYNYNHAAEIVTQTFAEEFADLVGALRDFTITCEDIMAAGGNETEVPKKVAAILEPLGWQEIKISGDLVVKVYPRKGQKRGRFADTPVDEIVLKEYIDGHNIDYVKGRVAVDMEWNSKDQTYDRDLFAFRTYYECGLISVAIIITRSAELNPLFKKLGVFSKYGASTTWIGKLLPRLASRRHGGCPVLAVAIKPAAVVGQDEYFAAHAAAAISEDGEPEANDGNDD